MSYRELTMIDVKELLRRWAARHSNRRIARETGTDRGTVGRYTAVAEELELPRDCELSEDLIHQVAQRVQARPVAGPSAEWLAVAAQKERIEEWLARKRPLRLSKIHTLLVRDHGLEASYDTLRRFAIQELKWGKKSATVRLDDPPPGQEAQVDFGKMGPMLDPEVGRVRMLWALIVTLSFSRYQFVWPTFSQTTEAVCEALDRAWWFFGGMTITILPDNASAMVKTADALKPTLVPSFLDYVQARGIFVDPARVRRPKDKPRVENQVPYVRESWFDGETFVHLDDARRSAEHWSRETAGTRIHGTTQRVPREVFTDVELAAMLPAPDRPFDVPSWFEKAKVHPDHHIQVARALYSVPNPYLGNHVRARVDKTTVKIFFGTELIKVHPRRPAGGRSTDTSDYPVGKQMYALRSVDGLVVKAKQRGVHVGTYAERLLGGPLPWTRMRQAYALLSLCDKYGDGRVEAVCQSALAFDVVDVTRIRKMLSSATKPGKPGSEAHRGKVVQLTQPRFARPKEHFETRSGADNKERS